MDVLMPKVLTEPVTQEFFAELVGISQPKVSQLISDGILHRNESANVWLLKYCERLRSQAAGRSMDGGLSLTAERAALARAQREQQELKNAVARGEFAPVALLTEVLALCGASIAAELDMIEGSVKKLVPDLPEPALNAILSIVSKARNTAIKETSRLVRDDLSKIDELEDIDTNHEVKS